MKHHQFFAQMFGKHRLVFWQYNMGIFPFQYWWRMVLCSANVGERKKKLCVIYLQSRRVWNRAGKSHNIHLIIAYSRPILCSIIAGYPPLQKLCKALFWCKTLRKAIELWGDFWALSSKRCLFFHEKVPFWRNIKCCL